MRSALFVLLLGFFGGAAACGYCVEDKIASTYDHAMVTQALAAKHQVVFFHIDGPLAGDAATKRWLEAAAGSAAGVDRGSVRVALDTLTLAVAYDPKKVSLAALQSALDRKLAARKLSLMPLRIIDSPGELAAIRRPN
jgi:hypothetical protein